MSEHTCHAAGCGSRVPPRLFMCAPHWRLVRSDLQRLIWRYYRKGQEVDKRPSAAYMAAHCLAVSFVAALENRDEESREYGAKARVWAAKLNSEEARDFVEFWDHEREKQMAVKKVVKTTELDEALARVEYPEVRIDPPGKVRGGGAGRSADDPPSLGGGFADVVHSVYRVPITVEEYERLERELSIEDETRPEVVRSYLNRAEKNALSAHRLYVVAQAEFEIFEMKCQAYMSPLRDKVVKDLASESDRVKKTITDADLKARMMALFPDQALIEAERREKTKRTVEHLARLAELWKKRTFTLQKLIE